MISIVGEAWSTDDERAGEPFTGSSGKLLNGMLSQVGINRHQCHVTNVFNLRPPRNDVKMLCGPKREGIPGMGPLASGKYVRAEYASELTRLYDELRRVQPTLILALGAAASWALLNTSGIRKIRGAPLMSKYGKVLPTYHPSTVLREWGLRPVVLSDFAKARRECEYPEIRRPEREIWVEPTIEDLWKFYSDHILPATHLSIDIETKHDQITCIGFAPTPQIALVVPFFDPTKPGKSYWSRDNEIHAWRFVKQVCALDRRILFQNGMYDIHFLLRRYGIPVPYASEDTMLLHHALYPEQEKGLGFLGSVYTDEASWKFMRHDNDTIKRED